MDRPAVYSLLGNDGAVREFRHSHEVPFSSKLQHRYLFIFTSICHGTSVLFVFDLKSDFLKVK